MMILMQELEEMRAIGRRIVGLDEEKMTIEFKVSTSNYDASEYHSRICANWK